MPPPAFFTDCVPFLTACIKPLDGGAGAWYHRRVHRKGPGKGAEAVGSGDQAGAGAE